MHWNAERKCVRGGREALHAGLGTAAGLGRSAGWLHGPDQKGRVRERERTQAPTYIFSDNFFRRVERHAVKCHP